MARIWRAEERRCALCWGLVEEVDGELKCIAGHDNQGHVAAVWVEQQKEADAETAARVGATYPDLAATQPLPKDPHPDYLGHDHSPPPEDLEGE